VWTASIYAKPPEAQNPLSARTLGTRAAMTPINAIDRQMRLSADREPTSSEIALSGARPQ
jgi:hypothetical protein